MKKNLSIVLGVVFGAITVTTACKPNGNNNSTDVHNSMGEGLDTTQLIYNDSGTAPVNDSNSIDTAIKNSP